MPTMQELKDAAEKAALELAEARAAELAREPMPVAEAKTAFVAAMAAHSAAQSHEDKHAAAVAGLKVLEDGKHKGRETDILAQHVIDAREALAHGEVA